MPALNSPEPCEGFLRAPYRLACQASIIDPEADIEFAVLRRQPKILTRGIRRQAPWRHCAFARTMASISGASASTTTAGRMCGLAVDLGTTTVALNLVDLERGDILYTGSFENPQRFGGSDIMHRISYDGGPFHGELRQAIVSGINFEIRDMCRRVKVRARRIYEVVIVGNATMRDLFFGFDVQPIGEKPYKSVTELEMLAGQRSGTALNVKARELGLRVFPRANVYGGPLISSHVGADVAADMLAVGLDEEDEVVLLVDVGTNTEVVVGNRHRMIAASCPAGPAFGRRRGDLRYAWIRRCSRIRYHWRTRGELRNNWRRAGARHLRFGTRGPAGGTAALRQNE